MNQIDMLLEPLRVFLRQVGDLLPRLFVAVVVLIAGWFLAKAAAFAISQNEPYMGRATPRAVKDFLIKSNVVV